MKTEKKFGSLFRFNSSLLIMSLILLPVSISSCNKTGNTGAATGDDATKQSAVTTREDIPFVQVQEMPVYPDGDSGLLKFLAENARYPEEAKKNNITGKVILRFIVEKDCSVSDVTVLQSADPLLDAEAVRVVSLLKFEKPAKNEGKIVRVFYMVPITFALK